MLEREELRAYLDFKPKSSKRLKIKVSTYLKELSKPEKEALVLDTSLETSNLYSSNIEFLRRAGFTSLEASAYAKLDIYNVEVRTLVARRVLALRYIEEVPKDVYTLIKLEESILGSKTPGQILKELRGG